jgi:hypothetical protein
MANTVTIVIDEKNKTFYCNETLMLGSTCVFEFIKRNTGESISGVGACVLRLLPKSYQRGAVDESAPFGCFVFANGKSEETTILKEEWLVRPLSHLALDTNVPVHMTILTEDEGPIATGEINILVATVSEVVTSDGETRVALFKGDKGDAGKPLTFDDLTDEQKELLKGERGGVGEQGQQGPKGDPNVYIGDSAPDTLAPFTLWVDPNGAPTDVPTLPTDGDVGDILYIIENKDGKIVVGWGSVKGVDGEDGKTYEPKIRTDEDGNIYLDWYVDGVEVSHGTEKLNGKKGDDGADGKDGADGTTFTPSIDDNLVLSWTNDGDKENPPDVDLMNPLQNKVVNAICEGMVKGVSSGVTTHVYDQNTTGPIELVIDKNSYVFCYIDKTGSDESNKNALIKVELLIGSTTFVIGATRNDGYAAAGRSAQATSTLVPKGSTLKFTADKRTNGTTTTIHILPLE